ncbi:MAG: hypothetical protein KF868_11835 [Acidobacteria bacterium]|nr:hypothetical protein [Acidobacteriota bacterium]
MTDIRSLEQTLLENLPWNRARIKFIARFLLAIYAVRTVNLSTLATAFSGSAQTLRQDGLSLEQLFLLAVEDLRDEKR